MIQSRPFQLDPMVRIQFLPRSNPARPIADQRSMPFFLLPARPNGDRAHDGRPRWRTARRSSRIPRHIRSVLHSGARKVTPGGALVSNRCTGETGRGKGMKPRRRSVDELVNKHSDAPYSKLAEAKPSRGHGEEAKRVKLPWQKNRSTTPGGASVDRGIR
jgi:hypothetical protein